MVIVASAVVLWRVSPPRLQSGDPVQARADTAQAVEAAEGRLPADVVSSTATRGAASAQVALVGFSDYQCPYCARHAGTVLWAAGGWGA